MMDRFLPVGPQRYFVIAGILVLVGGYTYLFSKNPKVALLLLGAFALAIIYFNADWDYWRLYFMVGWNIGKYAQ